MYVVTIHKGVLLSYLEVLSSATERLELVVIMLSEI